MIHSSKFTRPSIHLTCLVGGFHVALLGVVCSTALPAEPLPTGNAEIRGKTGDSEIVIRTTSRLAGAIDSLTWKGREFIDSADHGRQLQSASNFDAGSQLVAETFNPTEAGSRRDGAGPTSTSQLLHLIAVGQNLQTTNRMAFWLTPVEKSEGNPAKNSTILSNHLLTKRVQIGYQKLDQVIQYDVTFGLPVGEHHRFAVFEALTGYMPSEFAVFQKYNPGNGRLEPLDDGPGEQEHPVIMSTVSGSHAMGIYTPEGRRPGMELAGYGRFRFPPEKVVKWNCVFRITDLNGVSAGDYSFRMFVMVGDLATVAELMKTLHREVPVTTRR
jgi:hypothetical protein